MADTKLSALSAATLSATDEVYINDGGTSKKATLGDVTTYLTTVGLPRVFRQTSDHAISATTATEVTQIGTVTLVAGTYMFQYNLVIQSATATVSPLYGINYTGTETILLYGIRYWDSGPLTAGTATADNTNASSSTAQGPISGQVHNVATTGTSILAHTGGVGATGTNILVILEGVLECSDGGDLELWHGSETATSTTIKAGSSLMITRTA